MDIEQALFGVIRSSRWPVVRRKFLDKHPTCENCGGDAHVEVHHKMPVHVAPELELEETNLITLCESPGHNCHLFVGHLLDWKSRNATVEVDAANYLAKVKARP